MSLLLTLCFLWGLWVVLFTVAPLFSKNSAKQLSTATDPFSSEDELRKTLLLRDALLQKLVYGVSDDKEINQFSEEQLIQKLTQANLSLEDARLPWKPETAIAAPAGAKKNMEGCARLAPLLLLFFFCLASIFCLQKATSQEKNRPSPKTAASSEVIIPPPFALPNGNGELLPSVNQYILLPDMGKLQIYYVGMFSNSQHLKNAKIILPLPADFENLKITTEKETLLQKNVTTQLPFLETSLTEGIQQIRAEFTIPAFSGEAHWRSAGLTMLPGVTIFIMPEHEGTLRNFFSRFLPSINVWPARIINIPDGFRSILGTDPFEMEQNQTGQQNGLSRQLVRVSTENAPFPVFDVVGIVPSRLPIYSLAVFFFCFLAGLAACFFFRMSK